jgi:hypothetical protein
MNAKTKSPKAQKVPVIPTEAPKLVVKKKKPTDSEKAMLKILLGSAG